MNWLSKHVSLVMQLICIILLSSLTRFLFLDSVPTGITNDELDYVLNAKAVWLSGKDIGQQWNPLSFTAPTSTFPMAELPSLILSPFIGPLSSSLFHARWGYAFFGVILSVILYFLSYTLFKSRRTAFITGMLFAVNPWGIFFGRTALESPIAATLYFLFLLLSIQKNDVLQFFSLIPFVTAFFCYIGTKILGIPIAFICVSYLLLHKRKNIVFSASIIAVSFIVTTFFICTSIFNPSRSRMGELFLPTSSSVIETVDTERKNTLSSPLTQIFSNKITSYVSIFLSKYLNAFSPNLLFLTGDTRSAFSVWDHGYFYLIDLLFIFLGFFYMAHHHKKQLLFLGSLILIAPLPSVMSSVGVSYPLRSSLLFPTIICIIGYGISNVLNATRNTKAKIFLTIIILCIYGISVVRFMHIYFFRNPVANSEGFDFSSRIVSSYLKRSNGHSVRVLSGSPNTLYKHFLFDTNEYNKSTIQRTATAIHSNFYFFKNISFQTCELQNVVNENTTYIVEPSKLCEIVFNQRKRLQISQVSDNGSVYYIYNDSVCKEYKLMPYTRLYSFTDLTIEKLNDEEFCQKYITNPNEGL